MTPYRHKRGDTFDLIGTAQFEPAETDLSNWTLRAQVRSVQGGVLQSPLVAQWVDPVQRTIRLTCAAALTATWSTGPAAFDVELISPDGVVVSTPTFRFDIVEDQTYG